MPAGSWAAGWNVGDTVTAAEMNKGYGRICDSVAGGAVASFDTNTILGGNIPSVYKHLRLYVMGRSDTAAVSTAIGLRFNNDSGANYAAQIFQGAASASSVSDINTGSSSGNIGNVAAASATAGFPGVSAVDIFSYGGTTFNKVAVATYGMQRTTANGGDIAGMSSSFWFNTAAITRITVFPVAGNFIAGSEFTLYGMG